MGRLAASLLLALAVPVAAAAAKPKPRTARSSARRLAAAPNRPAVPERLPPGPPLHPARSTEPIVFVWPPDGFTVAADGEFILGSVSTAAAGALSINGRPVAAHRDGGFLAWLPVQPGTFTFRAELASSSGTAVAERRIAVPQAAVPPTPGKPAIEAGSLSPRLELELRAGDWLVTRMRGTPGHPARSRVGKGPWREMRELEGGVYEGAAQIEPGESFEPAALEYELGKGWSSVKLKGNARVSATTRTPAVATVKANPAGFTNIKTGPSNGFMLFPLPGTRLLVTGREGGSLRVRLSESLSGWIDAKDVELSAAAAPVRAVAGSISVGKTEQGAVLRVGLSERVAFHVEPTPALDGLTLRLFNSIGHTNWVHNEATEFVRELRWRQEETEVVAVTILLERGHTLWGWWPSQDGGGLRLELRDAPKLSGRRLLEGARVFLDPGHMPSAHGAIGPLGTREMDANYAIALTAKARLEQAGATVFVSRADPLHELPLADRPKQALERGADLFVSLHNNALPDGENPFLKPHGFSVFYYHPQSLALGRAVHEAYRSRIKLADEGLRWGNLLVARLSAMPAILIENAYMMFPEQEALLNDAAFRDELAQALVAGIESFLSQAGERPTEPYGEEVPPPHAVRGGRR